MCGDYAQVDSSVRIVTMLRDEITRNWGSISGRDKRSFTAQQGAYRLWGTRRILSEVYHGSFPVNKANFTHN
jgi:hypothetical protein